MQTHVIGQTLVLNEAGKLLLLTRSLNDTHAPGGLDLPGGRIDPGEEYPVLGEVLSYLQINNVMSEYGRSES